jgi:membrane protease YdiL (CAAX protease family)
MREVFTSPGGIRVGWRLLIFFAVLLALVVGLQTVAMSIPTLRATLQILQQGMFTPLGLLLSELIFVCAMVAALSVAAKIERRRIADYGWRPNPGAGRRFLFGLAFGLVMVAAMCLLQWREHVYAFGTWAMTWRAALKPGLVFLLSCWLVGMFEEGVFRGYAQFTLSQALGFWPAALLISAAFGLIHMLDATYKVFGTLSAASFGLLFAFCLWRTGDVWLAVGIHTAVDFAELFVFAASNQHESSAHLLNARLQGPAWLTGSTVGPEASINGYVVFALAFATIAAVYRRRASQ